MNYKFASNAQIFLILFSMQLPNAQVSLCQGQHGIRDAHYH